MNDLSMTNIQKKTKNPLNRADDMFGWKKVAEVRNIVQVETELVTQIRNRLKEK